MKIFGLRNRLLLAFLFLIIISLIALGSFVAWYSRDFNLTHLTNSLTGEAQVISVLVADSVGNAPDEAKLDTALSQLTDHQNVRITVIDKSGLVLADSWEDRNKMENHSDRPEVQTALTGLIGTSSRFSATLGEQSLYVAVPVIVNDKVTAVVRTSTTLAQVEAVNHNIQLAILVCLLGTSSLACLFSFFLARRYIKPIETIIARTVEIAAGQYEQRLHIRTDDELELLAHSVNNLTFSLEEKLNELSYETTLTGLILHNMDNAILLLDRFGRIVKANHQANLAFGSTNTVATKHILTAVGSSQLEMAVQKLIAAGIPQSILLKYAKKAYYVYLTPIQSGDEPPLHFLAVFHDITIQQEIRDRQSKFVTNASHEMATPLTSIIGYSESLADGGLENQAIAQKFVNTILAEANRLKQLVDNLMHIARLDTAWSSHDLQLAMVDMGDLLTEIRTEYAATTSIKQLVFTTQIKKPVTVYGNRELLKKMIESLVENSIHYTPPKGFILLECEKIGDACQIHVTDNGAGIPPSDLPFIFDIFYRPDPARSRLDGGAGLGLSVVKSVVDLHSGTVDVKSEVGRGTQFIINLPLRSLV